MSKERIFEKTFESNGRKFFEQVSIDLITGKAHIIIMEESTDEFRFCVTCKCPENELINELAKLEDEVREYSNAHGVDLTIRTLLELGFLEDTFHSFHQGMEPVQEPYQSDD